jgi:hypothetical protein
MKIFTICSFSFEKNWKKWKFKGNANKKLNVFLVTPNLNP